jgi:ABC-2 type transport system permease protein
MSAADLSPGRTIGVSTEVARTSVVRPRRRISTRFLRSELRLIFGRRRNQAGLGILALVPLILAVTVRLSTPRPGRGPDFFASITSNGLFVSLSALSIELALFLPLAVGTIAGDSIAGEANIGTLRYLLTVPVHRARLLAVKFAAIVIFSMVATVWVSLVGALAGLALFGGGEMTLLSGTQIGMGAAVLRVVIATIYLGLCFVSLGAIGLFISTLTEQPIGATIAVVIINIMSFILDSIPQLSWLHVWLPTHWWMSFGDVLRDPIVWGDLTRGLLTAAGYALVFWLAAWARFSDKDVTG